MVYGELNWWERERYQKHIETLMTTLPLSFLIISLYPIIKLKNIYLIIK
jgi:hypothetical protein